MFIREYMSETEIILPTNADIKEVTHLYEHIRNLLSEGKPIVINCGNVNAITSPVIQLIISVSRTLELSGRKLIIHEPSYAVQKIFADFGIKDQLEYWSEKDE
jgi:anti-anti-sigma regulatory factor